MDITLIKENDDGSADYYINLSHDEQAQIFRFAFLELLKRGIEEGKKHEPSEVSVGNTGSGEQDCVYGPGVKSGKSELQCVCDQVTKVPY